MSPRPRTKSTRTLWLGITAATTLAIGLVWAYQNLTSSQDEGEGGESNQVINGDNTTPGGKKEKNGSKPILCLSTPILPPPTLLKKLSECYTVHLLLPSSHRFSLPSIYSNTLDVRRILFHEKGEGLIHISRTLGGILIVVKSGYGTSEVEGDSEGEEEEGLEGEEVILLAATAREEEEGSGSSSSSNGNKVEIGIEPIKLEKLIKEVKSFVNNILIVVGKGGSEKVKLELEVEGSKLKVLEGWTELGEVLGV